MEKALGDKAKLPLRTRAPPAVPAPARGMYKPEFDRVLFPLKEKFFCGDPFPQNSHTFAERVGAPQRTPAPTAHRISKNVFPENIQHLKSFQDIHPDRLVDPA